MSKIAEQKALGAYPIAYYRNGGGIDDANASDRAVYEEGYDQAMQDFLEKSDKFFNEELFTRFNGKEYRVASNICMNLQQFIEQFKNYMENEEM